MMLLPPDATSSRGTKPGEPRGFVQQTRRDRKAFAQRLESFCLLDTLESEIQVLPFAFLVWKLGGAALVAGLVGAPFQRVAVDSINRMGRFALEFVRHPFNVGDRQVHVLG